MAEADTDFLSTLGRDPGPFHLSLDGLVGDAGRLECSNVVRAIPGKRLVCLARWQGREVFAKLYFGARRARQYWRRELAGIRALNAHGIRAPTLLYAGTADSGRVFIVLLAPIRPAESLKAAWERAGRGEERIDLMRSLVQVIARQHAAGLEQRDLHLNNFLLSQGKIYTLDGGDVRISRRALGQRRSLANLGLLFAQLYPEYDRLVSTVFPVYVAERAWHERPGIEARLGRRIAGCRRKRRDKYLEKSFRECSDFACERNFRRMTVYRRTFASAELDTFLADPDASLNASGVRLLKDGTTCTVWSTPVGEHQFVVKRYNIKGFLHGLNRALRRTRAAISWKNAHRLQFYGIAIASPVALIEERFGPFRRRAYFVAESVAGENALRFFHQDYADPQKKAAAAGGVVGLLERLAALSISHGDMKGTNIILAENGPVLIDLDASREHRSRLFFVWRQRRDIRRFLKNWQKNPRLERLFRERMRASDLDVE